MPDPGLTEFQNRVTRIEKAREDGFGFEAVGTLGRSFYTRAARRGRRLRFPLFRLLLVGFVFGTILKALLLSHLGTTPYQDRVAQMAAAGGLHQVGAWVLWADPVTLALARQITALAQSVQAES